MIGTKANPLANLRDIHLPPAISHWPSALGWWILAVITVMSIVFLVKKTLPHWRQRQIRRYAFGKLAMLEKSKPDDLYRQLSRLLRRLALANYPREQVASLTGKQWLQFLDETGNTNEFSQGIGKILVSLPYQNKHEQQFDTIFPLLKKWIERAI